MNKDELKKEATECWKRWYDKGGNEDIPELLYMFAEPREKRIAELEKEVIKWKTYRNNCEQAYQDKVEEIGIEIEKRLLAEKENTELKETVIRMNKVITETFSKLTKAKEALKSISKLALELYVSDYSSKKLSERIQDKAEQFLQEIEK